MFIGVGRFRNLCLCVGGGGGGGGGKRGCKFPAGT